MIGISLGIGAAVRREESEIEDSMTEMGQRDNHRKHAIASIPQSYRNILKRVHNNIVGHNGVERMIQLLNKIQEHWPSRREHAKAYIRSCPNCQKNQQNKCTAISAPFCLSFSNPMQKIYMDLIENLRTDEEGYL